MEKVYFVKMLTNDGTFEEIIWSDTQAGAKYRRNHPEKDGYSLKELSRRCSFGEKYIDPNNLTEKEKDLYKKMLEASNRRKRKKYVEQEVENTEDKALETSGDFNVYFMSKLPDLENVIGNTIYCVPIDPDLDIIKYQEDHKEALPDESVFKLYIPIETSMGREFVRIIWDSNNKTYVGIPDDEGPENEEPLKEDTNDVVDNTTNYILEALPGHLKARINKIFDENSTIYLYILAKINKIEDLCNNIIHGGSSISAEDNYYLLFKLIFELAKMDCFDADSISSLKTVLRDVGYSYIDELINNL